MFPSLSLQLQADAPPLHFPISFSHSGHLWLMILVLPMQSGMRQQLQTMLETHDNFFCICTSFITYTL